MTKLYLQNSEFVQKNFYVEKKDAQPRWHTLQNDINILSSEIVRLCRLPYRSKTNMSKICTLEKHIQYLEELLEAYKRDQKNLE